MHLAPVDLRFSNFRLWVILLRLSGLRGFCFVRTEHPVVLQNLTKTGAKLGTKRATSPGCSEIVPVSR
jgi:hypothetical protein